MAVLVGRCRPTTQSTGDDARVADGGRATARRTVVKAVDLESASVVWERPVAGVPSLETDGEVLLVVDGCGTRRIDLTSGAPLGGLGIACSDAVLAGEGVAIVSTVDAPNEWRVIDVKSGSNVAQVVAPVRMSAPRRIFADDPLTVLVGSALNEHLDVVVRADGSDVRVLSAVPSGAGDAFASASGDSLLLAGGSLRGATELSLDDGSVLGELPRVRAAQWIPFGRHEDGVLGFEGTRDELTSGHGRLTLRSLDDGSVTELGELGGAGFRGETNLAVAAPQAVVIGDVLLMPGHGNSRVLAYRLTFPD